MTCSCSPPPAAQAEVLHGLRKRLAELLDDPQLIDWYTAAMDGRDVSRMVSSLPYIDGIPVDGALRVRLTTAAGCWRSARTR